MVDYQLASVGEEVREGQVGGSLGGWVVGGEGVGFGDFDEGQGATFGGELVELSGDRFLFGEEGEAGLEGIRGLCDLAVMLGAGMCCGERQG